MDALRDKAAIHQAEEAVQAATTGAATLLPVAAARQPALIVPRSAPADPAAHSAVEAAAWAEAAQVVEV